MARIGENLDTIMALEITSAAQSGKPFPSVLSASSAVTIPVFGFKSGEAIRRRAADASALGHTRL